MKKMQNKPFLIMWCAVFAVIAAIVVAVNCVAVYWNDALAPALGVIGASAGDGQIYFESEYDSKADQQAASRAVIEETLEEGAVLLKNDGALPLGEGARSVSLFGVSSAHSVYSGSGSGASDLSKVVDLRSALEQKGFTVNSALWDLYTTGEGAAFASGGSSSSVGGLIQSVSEVPVSYYSGLESSYADHSDAAIVVIGRSGSEGVDLTRDMAQYNDNRVQGIAEYAEDQHYLELTAEEKDLLTYVSDKFENVVVLINSPSAMELGFVEDASYGIDAAMWIGAVGETGMLGVADVLAGNVSPSGRLPDTYVYDNFSAPATVNFGDFRYDGTTRYEGNYYYYVTYAEGIYVGYKYYETRYEDAVLGIGNAGDYDYDATVQYPFGYGESYTEFAWSDFSAASDADAGTVTLTVDVKNVGTEYAGKDVVEVYYQSPYTPGGIEKAAVELCGAYKTASLAADGSETATITIDLADLVSWDGEAGNYVREAGTYYVTVARNAHEAVDNILSVKDADDGNDSAFVYSFTEDEDVVYAESDNEYAYADRFDDADITKEASPAYDAEFGYLSRNDWTGTYPRPYATDTLDVASNNESGVMYTRSASSELMTALDAREYEAAGNPKAKDSYTAPVTGKSGERELIELRGKSYDDPMWDELLDQVTPEEMSSLVQRGGYTTQAMDSIAKPKTYDFDGPAGISSFLSAVDASAFPVEAVIGATWNEELVRRIGEAIGEEAMWSTEGGRVRGVSGWYAPAMNIHRTAFGGRNFEYYSEDAFLSGFLGSAQTGGVQSKGVYCYLKHFALNDQESNRSSATSGLGLVTWANEQTIREIYLKPFEMSISENSDGTLAVMTSFNRIGARWAGGSYALITEVLRNEWGFDGMVITDFWESPYMDSDQMLAAGGDVVLINSAKGNLTDSSSAAALSLMREAVRHTCYTVVNSTAMNGIEYGSSGSDGFPVYGILLIVIDVLAVAGIGLGLFFVIRRVRKHADA